MLIGRNPFFLTLFLGLTIPLVTPRLIWLAHSRRATGWFGYESSGTAGDMLSHSHIYFQLGGNNIWFIGPGGLKRKTDDPMPVRYLPSEVTNARIDDFFGLWGDLLVYGGIPELILLFAFLHPEVVPRNSRLLLTLKSPYIRLWSIHPN
jgi:hypothetical protein